jgi:hypothetical protein
LVPARSPIDHEQAKAAARRINLRRRGVRLDEVGLKDLIGEGRP